MIPEEEEDLRTLQMALQEVEDDYPEEIGFEFELLSSGGGERLVAHTNGGLSSTIFRVFNLARAKLKDTLLIHPIPIMPGDDPTAEPHRNEPGAGKAHQSAPTRAGMEGVPSHN